MSQTIKKQLENVVYGCISSGHSKRADKFNDAIDTSWKIYSDTSWQDMRDLARNLGDYIRDHHPDITRVYHIGSEVIQAYLESKASTCVDETLRKIYSRLKKFESCCKHVYFRDKDKFNWGMEKVTVPKSIKVAEYKKDKPIPLEVAKTAIFDLHEKRSETVNAVVVSTYVGTRVEESTCLKVGNIHFSGGEFGLGWVQIIKGSEGGAKGGRPRVIPIINKEAHDTLKSVVAGKNPDDYVVSTTKGDKMTPDNVNVMFRDVLKERHGDTYLFNGCHGLRKSFAQRYYDIVREKRSKEEAVSKTNMVLGHGKNRGEQGIKTYVANMH